MPIRVTCQACQKTLKAPDGTEGRTTKCPACGNPVTVPSASMPAAPAPVTVAPTAAASVARPSAADDGSSLPPRRINFVGIGAAAAGGVALVVSFVPLLGVVLGVPLAGLALILAAIGLALATVKRAGWISPVAGLSLGLAAILATTAVTAWFGREVAKKLDEVEPVVIAPPPAKPERAPDGTFEGQDRNDDGKLNVDELPDAMRGRFAAIDADGDGHVSRDEWDRAEASDPGAGPTRGKTIATAVFTAADDFVVDVWQNGRKLADDRRAMVGENFGATSEKLSIEVKEGDWLVFNVANNRLRWDGASYFGAAGVDDDGKPTFQSDPGDGRWSYCDDPAEVPAFIARPSYKADRAALPPANPWGGGDGEMKGRVADWSGKPVWGKERTTWIKYVAPAPGTWKPITRAEPAPAPADEPTQAKAEPAPEPAKAAEPSKPAVRLVEKARLTGHSSLVQDLDVTADGKTAVSGCMAHYNMEAKKMEADTVLIWDLRDGAKRRAVLPIEGTAGTLAVTPGGSAVVVQDHNDFNVFSLVNGRKIAGLSGPVGKMPGGVAVSPDGKRVAGGFVDAEVVLWDAATRRALRTFRVGKKGACRLAFSPDGKQLAAGSYDGVVQTWDLATGRPLATISPADPKDPGPVSGLAFTPDGKGLGVIVSGDDPILCDPATGERRQVLGEKLGLGYNNIAFSPDGRRAAVTAVDALASGGSGKFVEVVALLDVETGALLVKVPDPDGPTRGVAFLPDGKTLLSTGGNTVKVWEIAEGA